MTDPVRARLAQERGAILDRLKALVSIPSVSTDPAYGESMEAARQFLMARLNEMGFSGVTTIGEGARPAVYGEWLGAPGKPTLLVYGHYDVQPPDPIDRWHTPPFEPVEKNGRLYARGASDDKGPSLLALETLGAFIVVEGGLPVNIKILLEGEEEMGSPDLASLCRQHADRLKADAALSADGGRWRADLPTINVAARGNAGFELYVRTATKDVHSGRFGGAIPNALHVMATLIASLRDPDGGIVVDGFFDGATDPGPAEAEELAAIPFQEQSFFGELETVPMGEPGYTTLERLWLRPTLELNGMWGGYTGAGSKTVIPHEAHAKFTMRLVAGQDPTRIQQAVTRHLETHTPPGVTMQIRDPRGWCSAYALDPAHPLLAAAEAALTETYGRVPLRVRMGATLPMTDVLANTLGIATVMFSFATSDEDYHAPNEFFRLSSLDEGFDAWVRVLRRVGEQSPEDYAPFSRDGTSNP
ncbi:MAG: dipeptidase [Devosia sp.]